MVQYCHHLSSAPPPDHHSTKKPITVEPPPAAETIVFDSAVVSHEAVIPMQFQWPSDARPSSPAAAALEGLDVPVIDIAAFLEGSGVTEAASAVARACEKHGFFQVVNHGVDPGLVAEAHRRAEEFFLMPLSEKQKAQRKLGESSGYASSFTGRFSSCLPWKETLSFQCRPASDVVKSYFVDTLGEPFADSGDAFQEYCEAMGGLAMAVLELLGASLVGVDGKLFRDFYEDHDSIMRLNYYPPCQQPHLTLGTGPHCDPTSLTILHQDDVSGLQVLADGKWHDVAPMPNAFVVNIGDTFMGLTNGRYKSCLHRAVVNSEKARKSMAFFLCPESSKLVRPPRELVDEEHPRMYPDFRWSELLDFTQKHYRADSNTFDAFCKWVAPAGSATTP